VTLTLSDAVQDVRFPLAPSAALNPALAAANRSPSRLQPLRCVVIAVIPALASRSRSSSAPVYDDPAGGFVFILSNEQVVFGAVRSGWGEPFVRVLNPCAPPPLTRGRFSQTPSWPSSPAQPRSSR
jgi:hypothetical protein